MRETLAQACLRSSIRLLELNIQCLETLIDSPVLTTEARTKLDKEIARIRLKINSLQTPVCIEQACIEKTIQLLKV